MDNRCKNCKHFQKGMSDLISRQAAIDAAIEAATEWDGMFIQDLNVRLAEAINKLPSAQPERKKGKWMKSYADHEVFGIRPFSLYCSECNETTVYAYNYCPHCGADMRGEEE